MRRFKIVYFVVSLALALIAACIDNDILSKKFNSAAQLSEDSSLESYVVLGTFGNDWPARVMHTEQSSDSIEFSLLDGTPHKYSGFSGYDLKLVRLQGSRSETVIVFRSKEKSI